MQAQCQPDPASAIAGKNRKSLENKGRNGLPFGGTKTGGDETGLHLRRKLPGTYANVALAA
jgi:hypothetical protein